MRKIIINLLIFLALFNISPQSLWADVDIDSENFPDAVFRNYVKNNFDTDGDSILSDAEAEAVKVIPAGFSYEESKDSETGKITISKSNYSFSGTISDFTGIENFVNLETLAFYDNNVSAIDLSYNSALKALFCSSNNLSELDVSNNDALVYLECDSNKLTEIYLDYNSNLKYASCNSNDIEYIYIADALEYLYLNSNKLADADFVSDGTALKHLWIANHNLTELNLSANSNLEILNCQNNNLAELDLSSNTSLSSLLSDPQIINNQSVSEGYEEDYPYEFDLSYLLYNGDIENISNIRAYDSNNSSISVNYDSEYGVVQLASSPSKILYDYDTGLSKFNLEVTVLFSNEDQGDNGLPVNSSNFPDDSFRAYITSNFDTDSNGFLSDSEISNITVIPADFTYTVNSDSSITKNYSSTLSLSSSNLKGIEYFTALLTLGIDDLSISNLDLTKNTALQALFCNSNNISGLDLSSNTSLRYLDLSSNNLSTIDLSNNTGLLYLNCTSNNLKILDLSNNSNLNYLECSYQTISDQNLTPTGDSSYAWQFDLKTLVTASNISNIKNVEAYDNNGTSIGVSYGETTGIARFVSIPSEVIYNYSTGYSDVLMDVSVSFADPSTGITIDSSNFPDSNFRSYISSNFDTDSNGRLSTSEISNVTAIPKGYTPDIETANKKASLLANKKLKASGLEGVTDFTGLKYFTSLLILGADNNSLKNLDVSSNTLLEALVCNNNNLVSLDVSNNTALKILICNDNSLESLNLSNNNLLEVLNCSSNKIASLDLSNNTSLESFSGTGMEIPAQSLTEISEDSYKWQFDFASIAGSANIDNISDVAGYDSSGNEITSSLSSGIAKFYSQPSKVSYKYNTGLSSYYLEAEFEVETSPEITTSSSLPSGVVGTYYSTSLTANGSGTLTWRVSSGNLPSGLSINSSTGAITGTPTTSGTFSFYVTVSNGSKSSTKLFNITITSSSGESVAPSILTVNLPAGRVGSDYNSAISASGTTPLTWSVTDGSLPSGLSLNSSGTITGRPTGTGTFSFTVQALNSAGSDVKTFSILINGASEISKPSISTAENLPDATENKKYRTVIYAMGTKSITWSKTGGTLPSGLSLSSSGVITGTPTETGDYSFTLNAVNEIGNDSREFKIKVLDDSVSVEKPSITTSNELGTIKEGEAYSVELKASGEGTILWSFISGRLADGLTFHQNGTITGTPLASGNFSFKVQASNSAGNDTRIFKLTIEPKKKDEEDEKPVPVIREPLIIVQKDRTLLSLTEQEKRIATSGDSVIAAILDEVRINTAGTYNFDAEINSNVPEESLLVWNSFPRQGTESENNYVLFINSNGEYITKVPSNRKIKISAYLTPNVYGPVISAVRPKNNNDEDDEDNDHRGGGGGGGGCNFGNYGNPLILVFSILLLKRRS